ncbi:MAG: TAT-variant-translocated molybdopterin oxidoreductase [Bacteroidota bacterium]
MGQTTKKYWKGLEDLHNTEDFQNNVQNEFPEELSLSEVVGGQSESEASTGRRDFLKLLGFSVSAATLAACETPVTKVIPYVNKPENVTPGLPTYYATTYYDGNDYANILVKTREGRPIQIKSNNQFGMAGAANSRIIASTLSLYDSERLKKPMLDGKESEWSIADAAVTEGLAAAAAKGGRIVFLSNTIISPSTLKAINELSNAYPDARFDHVQWDTVSSNGITEANRMSFGRRVIPHYDFSKAKTIVGIGCDFLNTWLMSNTYAIGYAENRDPKGPWMSRHFQYETNMSPTGANADKRYRIKPSEEGKVLLSLYNQIAKRTGASSLSGMDVSSYDELTAQAATELIATKGESLVVCGSNNVSIQLIVNEINRMLENYGGTIDIDKPLKIKQGSDDSFNALVDDMNAGSVDALFVYGLNPAYSSPRADEFKSGLSKVALSVSFSSHADETSSKCKVICPDNHYLESWNDLNIREGEYGIVQPTITNLYNTRQMQASCLTWAGLDNDYYSYLKNTWVNDMVGLQGKFASGTEFWNFAVHDGSVQFSEGVVDSFVSENSSDNSDSPSLSLAVSEIAKIPTSDWELKLYIKEGIGDGTHAANPWLQELPDPITKVTWDNYVTMCPSDVQELGLNTYLGQEDPASVVNITVNGKTMSLPVVPSPGQAKRTIGVALGYGRGSEGETIGKAAYQIDTYGGYKLNDEGNKLPIGVNMYPVVTSENGVFSYSSTVTIETTKDEYPIAATQVHHTVMERESVVKETTLSEFLPQKGLKKGEATFNRFNGIAVHEDVNHDGHIDAQDKKDVKDIDLWKQHPIEDIGHRWGLSIDLNKCLGCGACVISCHSENNVPVVGKDEVRRGRDMHWLRIDRYFSSDYDRVDGYKAMRNASDDPEVVFMPMMCQHCNHAPCETVCPVAATTHSSEGINQMTYNRCIGTRYCANNCPYKVRRFNWFNYKAYDKFSEVNPAQDMVGRMVLNPDVTVRSRGVMEKCSMCIQNIQAAKLKAKMEGTRLEDGDVDCACSSACGTGAITFGDLNNVGSNVRVLAEDVRSYSAIEEVGTRPNVYYLTKVRNDKQS